MPLREVRCEGVECGGEISFIRAAGDVLCLVCKKEYWRHPCCANSRMPPQYEFAGRPEYILHVICDGLHVKL